jgi:hypothetical protein
MIAQATRPTIVPSSIALRALRVSSSTIHTSIVGGSMLRITYGTGTITGQGVID